MKLTGRVHIQENRFQPRSKIGQPALISRFDYIVDQRTCLAMVKTKTARRLEGSKGKAHFPVARRTNAEGVPVLKHRSYQSVGVVAG